jgi:nitrate/nitrite-specific signal transduction histidine kinase
MRNFHHRLRTKFIVALLLFLLILGTATAAVITIGFRQAQFNATQRSIQALQQQGLETLLQVTRREAQISDMRLNEALAMAEVAADYFVAARRQARSDDLPYRPLARTPAGAAYDPDPERRTDVWVDRTVELTPAVEESLRLSLLLDQIFPSMLAKMNNALAIYYMDPQGATRYYPVIDIAEAMPPDLVIREGVFFTTAAPAANPERNAVWTRPYVDHMGLGPIVTAAAPVYDGDEFLGIMGVDISLTQLIQRLNTLNPTPGSYALLVDGESALVAAPPLAVADLLDTETAQTMLAELDGDEENMAAFAERTLGLSLAQAPSEPFRQTLADMRLGASGLAQFDLAGKQIYLAYAPLATIGWSLAIVAPIGDLTAQSETVATAIRADANTTVRWILMLTTFFFGLALMGTALFTQRFLTNPIERLVAATQNVAAGDRSVSLTVHSQDELGQLADSFNQMTEQIVQAQQTLEQRVANRTRELSALYDVTAVANRSLDQETVLATSLDRVLEVMACQHGSIHLWDPEQQVLHLAVQHQVPPDLVAHIQTLPKGAGLAGWIIEHGSPLVIEDLASDPRAVHPTPGPLAFGRSYIGVPLRAKNKVLGVLSVVGEVNRHFNAEEVALLTTIADQVGVAVENARLYEQAEQLAVVEERQRLARELHDSVTQSLYSVNLMTETARRTASTGDLERTQSLVARCGEVARQALREMRLLVYELRPAALAQEGLVGALQQRLDTVEGRAAIDSRLLIDGDPGLLSPSVEATLYRIAQEALNNALKHAGASAVTVSIEVGADDVYLTITDNGKGFDPAVAQEHGGIGLKSMRERAEQLKGSFTLQSHIGEGTSIRVCLPVASVPTLRPDLAVEVERERL